MSLFGSKKLVEEKEMKRVILTEEEYVNSKRVMDLTKELQSILGTDFYLDELLSTSSKLVKEHEDRKERLLREKMYKADKYAPVRKTLHDTAKDLFFHMNLLGFSDEKIGKKRMNMINKIVKKLSETRIELRVTDEQFLSPIKNVIRTIIKDNEDLNKLLLDEKAYGKEMSEFDDDYEFRYRMYTYLDTIDILKDSYETINPDKPNELRTKIMNIVLDKLKCIHNLNAFVYTTSKYHINRIGLYSEILKSYSTYFKDKTYDECLATLSDIHTEMTARYDIDKYFESVFKHEENTNRNGVKDLLHNDLKHIISYVENKISEENKSI